MKTLAGLRVRMTSFDLRSVAVTAVVTLLAITASGCQNDQRDKVLESKITALERKLGTDDSALSDIKTRLATLELQKNAYSTVLFDPSSKGFQRLDTDSGTFLKALKDIKPYANGYKLILSIGNASSARYNGFTIHVKWSADLSKAPDLQSWENSRHSNDVKFTQSLYPGTWNTVAVILSPAKSDELENIEITMDTDSIYMFVR